MKLSGIHFLHLVMCSVHTGRKKTQRAELTEWTEKAAVAVDTPIPHEPGPEQQLVREKKSKPPQHSSPVISQVGKNQSGFQNPKAINSKIP